MVSFDWDGDEYFWESIVGVAEAMRLVISVGYDVNESNDTEIDILLQKLERHNKQNPYWVNLTSLNKCYEDQYLPLADLEPIILDMIRDMAHKRMEEGRTLCQFINARKD